MTTTIAPARRRGGFTAWTAQGERAYLLGLIILLFALWIPETFLTHTTFKLVFADQVVVAILGLALLVPLTAGAFDLSVGAMLASRWSSSAFQAGPACRRSCPA